MKPINIGICGLGTVGSGTVTLLQKNAEEIQKRSGHPIVITHIGARRDNADCDVSGIRISRDIFDVVRDPEVNILVELLGGIDTAREVVLEAISLGKHVVTANKALIAIHGQELFEAAEAKGVRVVYEGSVAGGIPIIKVLREGLAANKILWLAGIINGTGNYILSEMRQGGRAFDDVLAEAQALGYAEADPAFDVEGTDAAHKLTILASIAFGIPLQFDKIYTEGISHITQADVSFAEELGYRIKHLAIARRSEEGIELRVHPTLVPKKRLLANVNGVLNAVLVEGDAVGPTLYYGPGAGALATASAVVADIMDLVRADNRDSGVPHLGYADSGYGLETMPIESVSTSNYLRITAQDKVGVMAQVALVMSRHKINIEAIIQKEPADGEQCVPLILLTHQIREAEINNAIAELEAMPEIVGPITRIRMEQLDG